MKYYYTIKPVCWEKAFKVDIGLLCSEIAKIKEMNYLACFMERKASNQQIKWTKLHTDGWKFSDNFKIESIFAVCFEETSRGRLSKHKNVSPISPFSLM